MAITAAIHHETVYRYDRPVSLGPQLVRLRPAPHARIPIRSYALRIEPAQHFLNWQQDPFGNWLARCVFPEKVREFRVGVEITLEHAIINPFDFFVEDYAETFPFEYEAALKADLAPYLKAARPGGLLRAYLATIPRNGRTVPFLVELNRQVARDISYLIRMAPGVQTPEETLSLRSGSCRDSSWLLVQIARNLGFAARFVSGYLVQLKPDTKALDGPSGTDHDFTDLHAWAEIYLPGAGWIGFDPTSGLLCGEGHIPLAATPSFGAAAPITGGVEPAQVDFSFHMSVTRLHEAPRITAPFSDAAWTALDALGRRVDADLQAHDVRLTMGGEPTFVSIDDFQGAEWNTAAVGPTKRARADALIGALRARFAPNGLLHYGQGKWYPGEVLPRWAFGLFWREDGDPLWREPALLAREDTRGEADIETTRAFASALALRLGLDKAHVAPLFEDPVFLHGEAAKRAVEPVGHLLPLRRLRSDTTGDGWIGETWTTDRGRLYLKPGDSPAGWRLPLDALPVLPPDEYPYIVERDPSEARPALPPAGELEAAYAATRSARPRARRDQRQHVRTALVVELRGGTAHVFMPPVDRAEDYVELLSAVEHVAAALATPVRIEGYEPPRDPRVTCIKVTPDPGVIEVNVQPAATWSACADNTRGLYEDARNSRLTAEKFLIDGRHVGTGGGNHVVVGGANVNESPFLRRPDLLKSLLTYWQQHPSLSYLFSGLFIGPSSQAPRVDEARHDSLYELEIALAAISRPAEPPAPWLVDRLLRNLLMDASGNTHRTEICIDKLYSPDSATGRMGLVEFRGFEMPPDARMSLAQQLLLRALIAWFWVEPREGRMVRWGTALADRFMLSQFVWEDFQDVLDDLKGAGYGFEESWFHAQREFRFPFYGAIAAGDVRLELRQALEPWHVMGEEGAAGATVRYVDSSLERLEVRATGLNPERHAIVCNGRRVPLAPTRQASLRVGGVRFKAWRQPSGLHPTLPVQAPLRFDICDMWNDRSIGGCVYHVAHPSGRNYETFPVNGNEAEARRLARFVDIGGSVGAMTAPPPETNPEFAFTLDLRRQPLA